LKSSLPPLNSLVAFEAAARRLSFTKAADELGVSQGAISRQIKILEETLGSRLFRRTKPQLALTKTGQGYYEAISLPLARIADATTAIKDNSQGSITLVTTNAMAAFWLLPRYSRFQADHPEIEVNIIAVDSIAQLDQMEFDLGLYYCKESPEHYRATPLFEERVFPVCSPNYLTSHPEIEDPELLARSTRLVLDSAEDWIDWHDWFDSAAIEQPGDHKIVLNSYPLVIQAALNGQGVALAWETLVDDYLDSGLLVAPTHNALATQSRFYLLEHKRGQSPAVSAMSHWLQKETEA
jgi:LysR family glycine cleavage system transcriptional activator